MTKIVNLRLARKARDRGEAENRAAANRALHGRNKAQKQAAKAEQDRLARTVDGARLDD
jgi:hypothetical protein